MKKRIWISLALILAIMLSACGGAAEEPSDAPQWESEGLAYRQSAISITGNYISIFAHGGDRYVATVVSETGNPEDVNGTYEILKNDGELIYSPDDAYIQCANANDEGLWVYELVKGESVSERLRLLSFSGEILRSIPSEEIAEFNTPVYTMRGAGETLYLKSQDKIAALDSEGRLVCEYELENPGAGLVIAGDKGAYLANYSETGAQINKLSEGTITPAFSIEKEGTVYSGNEEYFLLLTNEEGFFSVSREGEIDPIIIWSDCGVTYSRTRGIFPLADGKFMMVNAIGGSILSPADPSDMKRKTTVVMATIGNADVLRYKISNYNMGSSEYYIEVRDYTDGGKLDKQTALTKLNIDISAGNSPDLMDFSNISPGAYISQGLLLDLGELMDADEELSRDDIYIADKLTMDGGIYYIDGAFSLNTRVGLYSDFGDAVGWTLEKYLEVEKSAPANMETMYNMTKTYFLREISARYIQTAIDWDEKTCDFDNGEFIEILDAASRIKETPEDPANMDYTPGYVCLLNGTQYTDAAWIGDVDSIKALENRAGCRLSVIGWPTVDGSCGSDIQLSSPKAIFAKTKCPEACWDYIKYNILVENKDAGGYSMPVYRPYIETRIKNAMAAAPKGGVQMTREDAERFEALIAEIKGVSLYDETALGIINEEASYLFAGVKTPEETARQIQSRISIYVAEQG